LHECGVTHRVGLCAAVCGGAFVNFALTTRREGKAHALLCFYASVSCKGGGCVRGAACLEYCVCTVPVPFGCGVSLVIGDCKAVRGLGVVIELDAPASWMYCAASCEARNANVGACNYRRSIWQLARGNEGSEGQCILCDCAFGSETKDGPVFGVGIRSCFSSPGSSNSAVRYWIPGSYFRTFFRD
jgi:hypothetical protein